MWQPVRTFKNHISIAWCLLSACTKIWQLCSRHPPTLRQCGQATCAPALGVFSFVFHRFHHHLPLTDQWRRKWRQTWKWRPCILLPVRIRVSVANARQPVGLRASGITQASKGALSRWKQRGEAEPRGGYRFISSTLLWETAGGWSMVECLNSKSRKNVSVLIKNLIKLFRCITSLPSAQTLTDSLPSHGSWIRKKTPKTSSIWNLKVDLEH